MYEARRNESREKEKEDDRRGKTKINIDNTSRSNK